VINGESRAKKSFAVISTAIVPMSGAGPFGYSGFARYRDHHRPFSLSGIAVLSAKFPNLRHDIGCG